MNDQPVGLKPWEPENLSPLHKNILTLIAAGMRAREISNMEGMPTESRISVIKNSPAGKAFLAEVSSQVVQNITEDVSELISSHSREAVMTVVKLMRTAESETVQLQASKDLLDRGGFKAAERHEVIHMEVAPEDVNRILAAMNEMEQEEPELHFYEDSSGLFKKEDEIVILD